MTNIFMKGDLDDMIFEAAQRAVNPVLTKEKATPRRGDFF